MEKEEELCRALSNFSITLKETNQFSKMKQLIKPPKLQVRVEKDPTCYVHFVRIQVPSEKFHEEQPLPDDDPIPDNPNQMKEVVEENNSALKQKKLPWLWKGQEESAEETQKEEKKKEEEKEEKMPWSSFPPEREPLHGDTDDDNDETDSEEESDDSSDEESDDSGFDEEDLEENLDFAGKREKLSPGRFLGLALGSALVGGSLGYCHAR